MPNWCENEITLTGSKSVIEKLHSIAKEANQEKGFFNRLVPRPKEQEENWYDWNTQNWGTKWDIDPDQFQVGEIVKAHREYSFNISLATAWSPPENFLKTLCKELDISANLRYIEGGMDFCGLLKIKGKEILKDFSGEIKTSNMIKCGFDRDFIEEYWADREEMEESE